MNIDGNSRSRHWRTRSARNRLGRPQREPKRPPTARGIPTESGSEYEPAKRAAPLQRSGRHEQALHRMMRLMPRRLGNDRQDRNDAVETRDFLCSLAVAGRRQQRSGPLAMSAQTGDTARPARRRNSRLRCTATRGTPGTLRVAPTAATCRRLTAQVARSVVCQPRRCSRVETLILPGATARAAHDRQALHRQQQGCQPGQRLRGKLSGESHGNGKRAQLCLSKPILSPRRSLGKPLICLFVRRRTMHNDLCRTLLRQMPIHLGQVVVRRAGTRSSSELLLWRGRKTHVDRPGRGGYLRGSTPGKAARATPALVAVPATAKRHYIPDAC